MGFLTTKKFPSQFSLTFSWIILLLGMLPVVSFGQKTVVQGVVKDAKTGETLISASVSFKGTTIGTNTDFDGNYFLETDAASDTLVISYLGFKDYKTKIKVGEKQTINVNLESSSQVIKEVVVKVDRKRYRNKNNPAVELIRKAIDKKGENRASNYNFYEFEKYEKVVLGLSNLSEKFKKRKAFKKFQFLFENLDTTSLKGKEILPIFLKEVLSDVRFRKSPKKLKEVVVADTMVTFKDYLDNAGINQYLENLYQNVNIYDNNITILNQQFLSPIAAGAPTFYRFYIQDTIELDGVEVIDLFFAPRNKLDMLFQGHIYIAYKDNYNVKKVDMTLNPRNSLNFVKTLELIQNFEKVEGKGFFQTSDEFAADFGLTKKGMGIFGRRSVSHRNVILDQERPDDDYKGRYLERKIQVTGNSNDYWEEKRHDDLTVAESSTYQKIDSLQNVKLFKRALAIASALVSGYTNLGPKFEIGPVNTFYSFSPVEGFRLRFGGRTKPAFSEKFELETYAAYGFKDKQLKGYVGTTFSLGEGNIHQFPVSRFRASAQREVQIPGQELQFVQEDNFLLSFKRGTNNKFTYNSIYRLEYFKEFYSNFSLALNYKNWLQIPTGALVYETVNNLGETSIVKDIQTSEVGMILRYAPREKFYQGKTYRIPFMNRYPKFTLLYNYGIKGLLGGEYNYHRIHFHMFKRFYLSQLGYSDFHFEAGGVVGKVPYPLLRVHTANQTYSYQLRGYNMMNFLEFVSDRYVSINIDHDFNGFFLNRIPLIRRLKWREAINIRVLYGGLRSENRPDQNDGLFNFPRTEDGILETYTLEGEPYIEGSVALANIFKFFRIDLVKRFNYLDNPNVTEWGVRGRFRIYF